ncbi:hypothetical protein ACRYKS_20335 [Escherichia coli]|jgi:hypothetical protein|uniref:Prohead core scaffold protein n=1 Tax=Escherichia phage fEgEco12 TaxID=3158837 RepID=A0AAU7PH44_9CAUD|nr:hypothetical protein [Escherichia coli]QAY00414.1 structural protein [Escherichia phage Ecwhy_1]QXN76366.1 hypothetical protein [Escherichia phage BF17]WGM49621.1 virion structural protein [Escherichia phage vB_Ec-M-J]EGE5776371.1 hypothetical protein [Escherichia coli]ELW0836299.1 hypothetical protein [Escherichia coli]
MSNYKKLMESASRVEAMKFIKLNESNIEKAEIVLSVKGEIVDKLQRQSEVINNMGVDVLGPLLDRIKAEQGLDAAQNFSDSVRHLLQHAVTTLMDVKDKISTETLKLTGDITDGPAVSDIGSEDVDIDIAADTPTFDMGADADFEEDIISEPVPTEREMKESVKPTQIGIKMESVRGTVGTKFFKNKEEMKTWLSENEKKVKRVLGYVKK